MRQASLCAVGSSLSPFTLPVLAAPVEFNRDIRPILSDRCYACHGPDSMNRKANLRLDVEAVARPKLAAVLERITSTNKALRMPPVYAGAALTDPQIATVKQWIEESAPWQKHWSFIPPVRREAPAIKNTAWPKNEIDRFLLARLEREGMQPSPAADRTTLIRRVTLDLTGIAPTPAEVDAFLADKTPGAYEAVVDRLLASPRYGERMAARWLDAAPLCRHQRISDRRRALHVALARLGDRRVQPQHAGSTSSPSSNSPGTCCPIPRSIKSSPPVSTAIIAATGKGGSIPEEFLVEYHADRVETTSTVWMGLTIGCSRCHDHKYDPFTQKEFYQLTAFFNNLDEKGKVFKYGNSPPMIPRADPAPADGTREEGCYRCRRRRPRSTRRRPTARERTSGVGEDAHARRPLGSRAGSCSKKFP
jgi:hypothetical protein